MPYLARTAAAFAAAVAFTLTAASADPRSIHTAPFDDDSATSATVEILRVADRSISRFSDLRIDAGGRLIGLPTDDADVLINNPAACDVAEPAASLLLPL